MSAQALHGGLWLKRSGTLFPFRGHINLTADPPSAEKTLLAHSADGEEGPMQVRVWPPQPSERAPWACRVARSAGLTTQPASHASLSTA